MMRCPYYVKSVLIMYRCPNEEVSYYEGALCYGCPNMRVPLCYGCPNNNEGALMLI